MKVYANGIGNMTGIAMVSYGIFFKLDILLQNQDTITLVVCMYYS